ncbi:hypothetical protein CEXT_780121 [Caerostris extrusa]|uniref:Uncharacterized protein n=1 Tax=Caerostris extrusa TaxID=172846 RepID=A0AAV4U1N8_CAEEX|nr:hypothetical protein CEXT_780121 [Caerostris extrusa]
MIDFAYFVTALTKLNSHSLWEVRLYITPSSVLKYSIFYSSCSQTVTANSSRAHQKTSAEMHKELPTPKRIRLHSILAFPECHFEFNNISSIVKLLHNYLTSLDYCKLFTISRALPKTSCEMHKELRRAPDHKANAVSLNFNIPRMSFPIIILVRIWIRMDRDKDLDLDLYYPGSGKI